MSVKPDALKNIGVRLACLSVALFLALVSINVGGVRPVAASPGIDLVVDSITLSPAEPKIGEAVSISVKVKNQGSEASGASSVACSVDTNSLGTFSVPSLQPGASETKVFNWSATSGSHTIRAMADSSEVVNEIDESNNYQTFTMVTLAVDLAIQSVTWTPSSPSKGDNVVFTITVKNQGNYRSSATNVRFYIDDAFKGYRDVPALDPGATLTVTYEWLAQIGQHIIRTNIDEDENITESDENNNSYTMSLATLPPDLIIEDITWSPENPSINDQVTFTVVVKNAGSGRSNPCSVAFFTGQDLLATKSVSALDAGSTAQIPFTWTVSSTSHQVEAKVDYYGDVTETNEANNTATAIVSTITPDLKVLDLTWTPQNAGIGDTVTFTVTIQNQGGGRAEASRAAYNISGSYWGYLDIPAINAGATVTRTFQATATEGALTITFHVDFDNKIAETYEYNNSITKSVPIILPDLYVENISWSPVNPSIGDTVTFNITIGNQGGGRADSFHVNYYLDDNLLSSELVYSLNSDTTETRTYTWIAQPGRHKFQAVVDSNTRITELDEQNNENEATIVPYMPDLAIGSIIWTPAGMEPGREITFSIDIINTGTFQAELSRIAYYIDEELVGYGDIDTISPGDVTTTQFVWVAEAGFHTLDVVADSNDEILEIDENNNGKRVNLPPPDLTIDQITWSPQNASIGDTVSVIASVFNRGTGHAQASQVTLYVDGEVIDSQTLPVMSPGQRISSSLDWTALSGTHDFRVAVDVANTVTEADETNNDATVSFSTLTPDLIISDFTWLMENPLIDDDVTFTVTVKNIGTDISPTSQLRYVIDDGAEDFIPIDPLAAGETATLTFVKSLEAGVHSAYGLIDALDEVEEFDETNNEYFLTFTTIAPDLIVKAISLSPADAFPGDPVTITLKIENRGREKASNVRVTLTINGHSLSYVDIEEIEVGAIESRDLLWTAEAGTHEFRAYVDLQELVPETNETNNEKSRTLEVKVEDIPAPPFNPGDLQSSSPSDDGFLQNWWWVFLSAALLLGGTAFVVTLKSIRKS